MLTRILAVALVALAALTGGCSPPPTLWVVEADRPCTLKLGIRDVGTLRYDSVSIPKGRTVVSVWKADKHPSWAGPPQYSLKAVEDPAAVEARTDSMRGRAIDARRKLGEPPSGPVKPQVPVDSPDWNIVFIGVSEDLSTVGFARTDYETPGVVRLEFRLAKDRLEGMMLTGTLRRDATQEEVVKVWGRPDHEAHVDGVSILSWGGTTLYFRNGFVVGSAR
jgi:hypothetical protein